jgi:hypothetical protein
VQVGKLHIIIMQEKHDVPIMRHRGEKTTIVVVGKRFNWLKLKEDVEHCVHLCQVRKH